MDKIPGYRFHPTDVELIMYFLKRKVMGKKFPYDAIAEVDIYKFSPWDLPDKALHKTGDLEWYFFCPTGKKYARGARMNRGTEVGFWKTTGKDKPVNYNNITVGMRKSLIFHKGKAPKRERTDWVMREFRLEEDKDLTDTGIPLDSYVICKVYQKEGAGPRNGAQYGKPFNEEDWDEEEEIGGVESVPVAALPVPVPTQPIECPSSVTNVHLPTSGCIGPTSVSCVADCLTHTSAPSNEVVDDDFLSMLYQFIEDETLAPNENIIEGPGQENNAEGVPCSNSSEIFEGLGDIGMDNSFAGLGDGADFSFGLNSESTTNQIPTGAAMLSDPSDFLELTDLERPFSLQNELDYGFEH